MVTKKKLSSIVIDGVTYPVVITYKKMKRMYLRVDEQQQILVSCPFYTDDEQIHSFLYNSRDWLKERFAKQENTVVQSDSETINIFGKTYPFVYVPSNVIHLEKRMNEIYCYGIHPGDGGFENLFYHECAKWMIPVIKEMRKEWDTKICDGYHKLYPKITLKYMTSRWGSCSPGKSHISISVRLIHYPVECLQYVLLHEYVHLLVPNHSKQFYATVEKYMPDWNRARNLLK